MRVHRAARAFACTAAVRGKTGLQQMVDLPGGVAAAADFDLDFFRSDQAGGVPLFGAGIAQRNIADRVRGEGEGGGDGEVERIGNAIEDVAAAADAGPRSGGGADGAVASEDDDAELGGTSVGFGG